MRDINQPVAVSKKTLLELVIARGFAETVDCLDDICHDEVVLNQPHDSWGWAAGVRRYDFAVDFEARDALVAALADVSIQRDKQCVAEWRSLMARLSDAEWNSIWRNHRWRFQVERMCREWEIATGATSAVAIAPCQLKATATSAPDMESAKASVASAGSAGLAGSAAACVAGRRGGRRARREERAAAASTTTAARAARREEATAAAASTTAAARAAGREEAAAAASTASATVKAAEAADVPEFVCVHDSLRQHTRSLAQLTRSVTSIDARLVNIEQMLKVLQ